MSWTFEIRAGHQGMTLRQRLMALVKRVVTWDWVLRADNGKVVATSGGQGYERLGDAYEAVERLMANIPEAQIRMCGERA